MSATVTTTSTANPVWATGVLGCGVFGGSVLAAPIGIARLDASPRASVRLRREL